MNLAVMYRGVWVVVHVMDFMQRERLKGLIVKSLMYTARIGRDACAEHNECNMSHDKLKKHVNANVIGFL